jgi:hypothetical protein
MSRSLRCTLPALVLLTLSCTDAPLGTDAGLDAPAPEFLIGSSPLIVLDKSDPVDPRLEVEVEVTKGIVQAADNDKFLLRATTIFKADGTEVGFIIDIDKPTPTKQDQIRGGSSVAVIMDMDIPFPDVWDKLVNAANQGATITADVTVELLLIDGAAAEHILDSGETAGFIMDMD